MRIPLEDRKQYVATIPWMRRLKRKVACDGWMAPHGRRKCKNPAEWSYRLLRRAPGGYLLVHPNEPVWSHFCWSHLFSHGLYGSMEEEARSRGWMEKNPPPWRIGN